MTTNKPEVVAWYTPTTRDTLPVVALNDRSQRGEPLIRLSEYEALQAECEKLRKDAERYRWIRADALSAYEDDLDEPQLVYARECVGDYQDCIDAAIDAAMQEGSHDNQ